MRKFFVRKCFPKLFSTYIKVHVTREKLPKRLSYEKGARKMLMKLTTALLLTIDQSIKLKFSNHGMATNNLTES